MSNGTWLAMILFLLVLIWELKQTDQCTIAKLWRGYLKETTVIFINIILYLHNIKEMERIWENRDWELNKKKTKEAYTSKAWWPTALPTFNHKRLSQIQIEIEMGWDWRLYRLVKASRTGLGDTEDEELFYWFLSNDHINPTIKSFLASIIRFCTCPIRTIPINPLY